MSYKTSMRFFGPARRSRLRNSLGCITDVVRVDPANRKPGTRVVLQAKVGYSPTQVIVDSLSGGDLVSTWALKQEEHTGENEDLDKNIQTCTIKR